jgi:hypothetical protein
MDRAPDNPRRLWVIVAAMLLAAAIPVGIVWTLSLQAEVGGSSVPGSVPAVDAAKGLTSGEMHAALRRAILFDWIGVGAAAAGVLLLVLVALGRPSTLWLRVAAIAPITFLVLCASPQALSRDWLPLLRWGLAVGAMAAYLPVVLILPGRLQYGVCCSVLGVAAVFLNQWEPPPPRPVAIAKPLALLEQSLVQQLNQPHEFAVVRGPWAAKAIRLSKDVEVSLGADDYIQLQLQAAGAPYRVTVFVPYYANARSLVPHVPWVCMTQAGFRVVENRQDDVAIRSIPGKEIQPNVILAEGGEGQNREQALIFHYFNVGGTYTSSREMARALATSGAIGRTGSFLTQTQVIVWLPPQDKENPLSKNSPAYQLGIEMLNILVPLLEKEHYPNLHVGAGG